MEIGLVLGAVAVVVLAVLIILGGILLADDIDARDIVNDRHPLP